MKLSREKKYLEKAKDISIQHLQPFLEGLRKEVFPDIASDDHKGTKMFTDIENKIYDIMKKVSDEADLQKVKENEDMSKGASTPEGFEHAVKQMKKNKDIDNPWALAWSMKNKGYKPHNSRLLNKRAMDAVNEELAKPTYEPKTDFDRQDSPFYSKGVEDNKIAPDPKKSSFEAMPKEFAGSLAELGKLAMKEGYFRARGTSNQVYFLKNVDGSPGYDYEIYYYKDVDKWKMKGGEVRVRKDKAEDIDRFLRKHASTVVAEIKQHKAPTKLPPREDARTHMDQEVKNEMKNDPDMKKESRLALLKKNLNR